MGYNNFAVDTLQSLSTMCALLLAWLTARHVSGLDARIREMSEEIDHLRDKVTELEFPLNG